MTLPDSDTLDTYGGSYANYGNVVDESTDLDAAYWNKLATTVAMGSRMFPRVRVSFLGHATTPTIASWESVWKGATATAPVPAHSATGIYTLTLPASVNDELVVAHSLNLLTAWGQAQGATAYHVQASLTSPNVITVWVFDMAGALADAVGVTIVAWAGH